MGEYLPQMVTAAACVLLGLLPWIVRGRADSLGMRLFQLSLSLMLAVICLWMAFAYFGRPYEPLLIGVLFGLGLAAVVDRMVALGSRRRRAATRVDLGSR